MKRRLENVLAILDVGHGNSAVLIDRDGIVVFDTGTGSALSEFLVEQEIVTLDVVLLSHADMDHIGGLIQILASKRFQVGKVRLNTDSLKNTALWDDLLYELNLAADAGDIDFAPSLVRDSSGQFDQGAVRINVIAPSSYLASKGAGSTDRNGRSLSSNSMSAVIRLEIAEEPLFLFPGDLDHVGLSNLLENEIDFCAPICVFPHHGGRPGSARVIEFVAEFCNSVRRETVIFSIGRGVHSTPRKDVVAALRSATTDVRVACTQLSEHCADRVPSMQPTHLAGVFSRGAESRCCCSGTLLISLEIPAVSPDLKSHARFIDEHAPTALCKATDFET